MKCMMTTDAYPWAQVCPAFRTQMVSERYKEDSVKIGDNKHEATMLASAVLLNAILDFLPESRLQLVLR